MARPRKKADPRDEYAGRRAYHRMYLLLKKDPIAWAEYQHWRTMDKKRNPDKYSRKGIPDGMRRAEAIKEWAIARGKASMFMEMIDQPFDPDTTEVPNTDEGKARAALHEATAIALFKGPQMKDRLAALSLVLAYTKEKPVVKTDTKLSSASDWLKAAVEDSKK